MNCHLTDQQRKDGARCRSWDCKPCFEFGTSTHDQNLIRSQMLILKENEIESLRQQLTTTQAELKEAREVIRFYSNHDNWLEPDGLPDDYVQIRDDMEGRRGGFRARAFLAKYPKEMSK